MDPFLGEIRIFSGKYAPKGWHFCDGTLLPINQNQALYSLLHTTYGGDGQTTFALPDLRGRTPIHQGISPISRTQYPYGDHGGQAAVALGLSQIPSHTHEVYASNTTGPLPSPQNNVWAQPTGTVLYTAFDPTKTVNMAADALGTAGGGQPHNNMQPFLGVNFIICLSGIYPPHD